MLQGHGNVSGVHLPPVWELPDTAAMQSNHATACRGCRKCTVYHVVASYCSVRLQEAGGNTFQQLQALAATCCGLLGLVDVLSHIPCSFCQQRFVGAPWIGVQAAAAWQQRMFRLVEALPIS